MNTILVLLSMHQMENSPARMMESILFMQLQRYKVNVMAGLVFMSMDLKKFVIIIATMVLVVSTLNTPALKVSSNLPKAILFIFTCMDTFTLRVQNVIEHIFKVTLLTFCKISLILYKLYIIAKIKGIFP